MRLPRVGEILKLKGNRRMEFCCQGQKTSQIFRSVLLKEARMRKDWGDDGQKPRWQGKSRYIKRKQGKVKWLERYTDEGRRVNLLKTEKTILEIEMLAILWLQIWRHLTYRAGSMHFRSFYGFRSRSCTQSWCTTARGHYEWLGRGTMGSCSNVLVYSVSLDT